MLVLSRGQGQGVLCFDEQGKLILTIRMCGDPRHGARTRFAIDADPGVTILREEVYLRQQEERSVSETVDAVMA